VPVTFDRSATPAVIRLEGEVDIGSARALKEVLLEALAAGVEARISLESATGIDVTAVQLLWAAEQQARASSLVLALQGPVPEALRAGLREAGFERLPLDAETQPEAGVR